MSSLQTNSITKFILLALATYRVARMIATEDGPLDLFSKLRAAVDPKQNTWLGRGLHCPLCVGFWASLVMLQLGKVKAFRGILVWLALAGLQTLFQKSERN